MNKDIDRIIVAMCIFGLGFLFGIWTHESEFKRDCTQQLTKVKL